MKHEVLRLTQEALTDAAKRSMWESATIDLPSLENCYLRGIDDAEKAHGIGGKALTLLEQEPLFWYRPRSDGLYEGPIHNAQIERVRKESGGWVPLYARLAAAQPECDSQPLTDGETAKLVNQLRDIAIEFHDSQQLRERIAQVIRPVTAQPAQPKQATEADDLLRALGLNPDAYRTDGGAINHLKVKAALTHPQEYLVQAVQEPDGHAAAKAACFDWLLNNCVGSVKGWLCLTFETSMRKESHEPDCAKWVANDIAWSAGIEVDFTEPPEQPAQEPPQPTPDRQWVELTDAEIDAAQDSAAIDFRISKGRVKGQQLMPSDSFDWWFARAIEAALREKNGGAA